LSEIENATPRSIDASGRLVWIPVSRSKKARLASTLNVPRIMNLFIVRGRDA
jgi:hypothetical protein